MNKSAITVIIMGILLIVVSGLFIVGAFLAVIGIVAAKGGRI